MLRGNEAEINLHGGRKKMTKKYKITRIQTITVDIEAKDDAEMRALYSNGTVDDHLSQWEGLDREEAVYIYQVDGNIVDIWKEKDD